MIRKNANDFDFTKSYEQVIFTIESYGNELYQKTNVNTYFIKTRMCG